MAAEGEQNENCGIDVTAATTTEDESLEEPADEESGMEDNLLQCQGKDEWGEEAIGEPFW